MEIHGPQRFRQRSQGAITPVNHSEEVKLVTLTIDDESDLLVGQTFLPPLLLCALHQI